MPILAALEAAQIAMLSDVPPPSWNGAFLQAYANAQGQDCDEMVVRTAPAQGDFEMTCTWTDQGALVLGVTGLFTAHGNPDTTQPLQVH